MGELGQSYRRDAAFGGRNSSRVSTLTGGRVCQRELVALPVASGDGPKDWYSEMEVPFSGGMLIGLWRQRRNGKKQMASRDFIRSHTEVLAAVDFFTAEVWMAIGLITYYVLTMAKGKA